jgi:CRISPR-associated protein Csm4
MKLYKATIKAKSNFATLLKGDTLFGQICWYIRLLEGENRLKELLENYEKKPFLVVSDAFISAHLPKPKLPSFKLGEDPNEKKENKKRVWLEIDDFFNGNFFKAKKEAKEPKREDEVEKDKKEEVVRNSINYKLFKTDGAEFSPYSDKEYYFNQKDIYFLIDDDYLDLVKKAFKAMSIDGFGKDKTIGKGRFEIVEFSKCNFPLKNSKYYMTLSPMFPKKLECKNFYYDTFVRFGKLGMNRANTNAFKKPILFANSAAVIELKDKKELQYLGKAVTNISTYEDVVQQGYSIVLPLELKDE